MDDPLDDTAPSFRRPSLACLALLGCAAVVLGSCSTPVSVRRVGPQTVHRELTQSVLTTGYLSGPTRNTLCDWNLDALFEDDPAAALAELHAAVVKGHGGPAEIFALAELSFAHAEYEGSRENYLAASIYAYAFLFPGGAGKPPSPFDPRLRLAADLYNRGLTSGFGSDDGEEVVLRPGVFQLPFGELEVRFDEADLRWGDRKLVQFVPVAELEVRGMKERYRRTGIGAPLAAGTAPFTPDQKLRDFVGDTTKVPVTALLRIDDPRRGLGSGRLRAELRLYDAYHVAVVEIDGQEVPLEVEPTACLAYTLSGSGVWDWELGGFFSGDFLRGIVSNVLLNKRAQVLFMYPYRAGRIPVVLVHGTISSPGRWADMLNTLENDPELRERFQFWFFYYESGNPITISADRLRESLANIVEELDPAGTDLALRRMVIIGHSQGGLLTKMAAIDTQTKLWDGVCDAPLDTLLLREETREMLRRSYFFQPLPFVKRVIFLATPHRGSYMAGSWIAHRLAKLITFPSHFLEAIAELATGNPGKVRLTATNALPTSIHDMTPGSTFVEALAAIPIAPGIASHSIVAVDGDGPLEKSTDGFVQYSSAHDESADSELVVRSGHSVQAHPLAIAEVRRILRLHAAEALQEDGAGVEPAPAAEPAGPEIGPLPAVEGEAEAAVPTPAAAAVGERPR